MQKHDRGWRRPLTNMLTVLAGMLSKHVSKDMLTVLAGMLTKHVSKDMLTVLAGMLTKHVSPEACISQASTAYM